MAPKAGPGWALVITGLFLSAAIEYCYVAALPLSRSKLTLGGEALEKELCRDGHNH